MSQMADLDVIAQEHGIDTAVPGALEAALAALRDAEDRCEALLAAINGSATALMARGAEIMSDTWPPQAGGVAIVLGGSVVAVLATREG